MSKHSSTRRRYGIAMLSGIASLAAANAAYSEINIAQVPLFVTDGATPKLMVNLPVDHQLYHSAYDDHTDLSGDGNFETTYTHEFEYFGYFDPRTCYDYVSGENHFSPAGSADADGYCGSSTGGDWSGNFLNWATMSRIDTVRKILYGGKRSEDTTDRTVIELSYIPNDAHSFAKYYGGSDINRLTPFNPTAAGTTDPNGFDQGGITICNTTYVPATTNLHSQQVDTQQYPPLMRVAQGNYSLWAGNHRWQCQWNEDSDGRGGQFNDGNDNDPNLTGIPAHDNHPSRAGDSLGVGVRSGDFAVRAQVCDEDAGLEDNCKEYPDGTYKPTGLLQEFGDDDSILFGLLTGSFERNKSGGVLRKNISSFADEVDQSDIFTGEPGIVTNLDALRIYGYRHGNGTYHGSGASDNCPFGNTADGDDFVDGDCSNWGNPVSEMFLESLRYFGGLAATPSFNADDSSRFSGLTTASWEDPYTEDNFCAPANILQFNQSSNSYEDQNVMATGYSELQQGSDGLNELTDSIGANEDIHGRQWFVGQTTPDAPDFGSQDDFRFCDGKLVNSLANARGICPDEPRHMGSYQIAGMALGGYRDGVRGDLRESPRVQVHGVSLATPTPTIDIPGTAASIAPACLNRRNPGNCSLVDFQIAELSDSYGKFYVNWEEGAAGGDYDTDVWGIIEYSVNGDELDVTTQVGGFFADPAMAFGYTTTGTDADGFHAHSGVDGVQFEDPTGKLDCTEQGGCQAGDPATTETYQLNGGSAASALKDPLWYAAKYGNFDLNGGGLPTETEQWDTDGDGNPDNYYFAADPAKLADDLREVFARVADQIGSSAAVAANTAEISDDTLLYQARFDTADWSGDVVAFGLAADGSVADPDDPVWRAADGIPQPDNRRVFSIDRNNGGSPGQRVTEIDDLTQEQSSALNDDNDLMRYLLLGDPSNEVRNGGPFRDRENTVLGTIVNSEPAIARGANFGYSVLSGNEGETYRDFLESKEDNPGMLYFGANDGMLHAVSSDTGAERFAFAPDVVFEHLGQFAQPGFNHRYYVDGQIEVADARHSGAARGDGWSKILAGAAGAGGRSVFALDVTNPDSFGEGDVLWELTGDDHDGLGHVLEDINIVRMNNDEWAVVFGNGYNSNDQTAQLFIVPIDDPENPIVLEPSGQDPDVSNGLGGVATVDLQGNGIIDWIYAGDLQGNMWRFDVTSDNDADWSNSETLLLESRGPNGEVQPITAAPRVTPHSQAGVEMNVLFGTGRLFASGDNVVGANPDVQSFYALKDDGTNQTISRADGDLVQQSIVDQVTDADPNTRTLSDEPVPANKDGWYIDLIYQDVAEGERVVDRAALVGDRVFFLTQIPEGGICDFGGRSWLLEMNAETGGLTPTELVDGDPDIGGIGFDQLATGLSGLRGDGSVIFYPSLADGTIEQVEVPDPGSSRTGRRSWQELR